MAVVLSVALNVGRVTVGVAHDVPHLWEEWPGCNAISPFLGAGDPRHWCFPDTALVPVS